MKPTEVIWPLERHTLGKHEVLRRYLEAWFGILGTTQSRIVVIDGFAGPGQYAGGEQGSPLIALRVLREHRAKSFKADVKFGFIEKDKSRADHLRALIENLKPLPARCEVDVKHGAFDETMIAVLNELDAQRQKLAPAFVMVDPFGVSDTPMAVIERILRGGMSEVYVSLMYREIHRFGETPQFEKPLDALFGTAEWRQGIDLQGEERKDFFYGLYERQLRRAGAKHVLHFDLYEGQQLVYAIFFATRHWLGSNRMKQAIWKVAPFGDYAFHGTKQLLLGLDTVDYAPLRRALEARFKGQGWTSMKEVNEFVGSDQTDFHTGQLKRPVLVPMEDERVLEIDPKTRAKRHTYPDGTMVRFV